MRGKLLIILFISFFNNVISQQKYYAEIERIAEVVKLYAKGNYFEVLPKVDNVLRIIEKVDSKESVNYALLLQMTGTTNMRINRIPESIMYYNKALRIWNLIKQTNNENNIVISTNLAKLYQGTGNYDKAEFHHKRTLELAGILYGKINSKYYNYIYKLGNFYYTNNQKEKCIQVIEEYTKYLTKNREITSHNFIMAKLKVADYYGSFLEQEKRFQILEEIAPKIVLLKQFNNIKNGFVLRSLAIHYYYQGDLEKSFKYFSKVLEHYSKGYEYDIIGPISISVPRVASKGKDLNESINFILKKLNKLNFVGVGINYREFEDITILSRQFLELSNNHKGAKYFFYENIKSLQKNINDNHILMTEYEKEKNFTLLNSYYATYYSFVFKSSKEWDTAGNVYNTVLFQKNQLLKSTVTLKKTIINSKDKTLKTKYEEWIKLKSQISKWKYSGTLKNNQELDKLNLKYNQLERELILQSKIYETYNDRNKATYFDVKNSLKRNEFAVEFIDFDYYEGINSYKRFYYALIISPNSSPSYVYLCSENQLKEILSDNIDNQEKGIAHLYGSNKNQDNRLYNLIWKPLEKSFYSYDYKKKPVIFYSPSGLLNKVSFSALRNEKGFLMEQYNLNQVSATSNLLNKSTVVVDSIKTIGLVGGIDYGNKNYEWNYLEGSAKEVENISTSLKIKSINISLLKGKKATKKNFSLTIANKDIVHIATHGYFKEENNIFEYPTEQGKVSLKPNYTQRSSFENKLFSFKDPLLRTGLVFAPNLNDDSEQSIELNGIEITQLNFERTKLVVLSACETGLGDIKGMQGVYGLQRAFKLAGVEKMVISLWKVPDKETQEFMERFYTLLFEEKLVSLAFKRTQQEMSQKYAPYYWASFILLD